MRIAPAASQMSQIATLVAERTHVSAVLDAYLKGIADGFDQTFSWQFDGREFVGTPKEPVAAPESPAPADVAAQ